MNRRSFFQRVLGLAAFAKVLPAVPAAFKARATMGTGYVYAPYIPKTEVTLTLVSEPVVAKVRKLSARWVAEKDQSVVFCSPEAKPALLRALRTRTRSELAKLQ